MPWNDLLNFFAQFQRAGGITIDLFGDDGQPLARDEVAGIPGDGLAKLCGGLAWFAGHDRHDAETKRHRRGLGLRYPGLNSKSRLVADVRQESY